MKHFAIACVLAALPLPAVAQVHMTLAAPCYEGKEFIKMLDTKYHEVLTGAGLTKNGDLIQTFVSPDNTFTILRIMPAGLMCMIASGENWQAEKPTVAGNKL